MAVNQYYARSNRALGAKDIMLLNLNNNAVLDITDNKIVGIGWNVKPVLGDKQSTIQEVEKLLGYEIVTWGDFINPVTKMFWTEIAKKQ